VISIREATDIIRAHQPAGSICEIGLADAFFRTIAEQVKTPEPLPRFTNSAMDGFAVRWTDLRATTPDKPVELLIVGESSAGEFFAGHVDAGEAVRINTGAMLPAGTDTVIPVEKAREKGDIVTILDKGEKAQFVRNKGEEFSADEEICAPGDVLTPGRLGLLASVGIHKVKVYKEPRLGLIATGDELVDMSLEPAPGKIRDANTIMLQAAIRFSGAQVVDTERVQDDPLLLEKILTITAEKSDIVLLTGGVSVGPHDLVREIAQKAGFIQLFWRVMQKPGKPLFVAKRANTLLFGLPGNPVSALSCYAYYVHPVLRRMIGKSPDAVTIRGFLDNNVINDGDRTVFLRIRIIKQEKRVRIRPLTKQESHMLSSIDRADGFILVEPGTAWSSDHIVDVYLYPWINYEELYRGDLHES
jgi:molybdopterin molybdotransferase